MIKKSKKTGSEYKEFNFKFNFAIKDLYFNKLLTYTDSSPIRLTDEGLCLDIDNLDVQKDIIETSKKHWEELSQNNKKNEAVDISDNEEESEEEEKIKDNFKEKLLVAISKMTPKKFEAFSRALLTQISFTKSNEDYTMREIMRFIGSGVHHSTMTMNSELFKMTTDEKKELLRGMGDVTGYIRKSNIAYGNEGWHRVYIEIPGNWQLVIDIANMLKDLDIPVQTIDFGHPNFRDSSLKMYNKGKKYY